MTLRELFSVAVLFAAINGPLHAIDKMAKPEVIEPWKQHTAKVSDRIILEWKFLVFPEGIRVLPGEYKIQYETVIDGKNYALIPAARHIPNSGWVERHTGKGIIVNCFITDIYFLPVEIETGTPLNRAFFISTGNSYCGSSFFPFSLNKLGKFSTPPTISFTRQFQSDNEYRAYLQSIETKNTNVKQDQYNLRAINNSSKQKIGTRICKAQGSTVFIGYTEKVSPDNGKIQVRISDASSGGPNGRSMDDFKETIIWEDPTLWDLCE